MSFVELDDVDVTYGGGTNAAGTHTPALSQLSMRLEQGAFAAVVGPSGCGKSTLLKLISGLIRPSRGAVRVADRRVGRPLAGVGMAFQNATLLPWRNVRDNVSLPLEIVEPFRSRCERGERRRRADELLAAVGLAQFGDRMPWQLSGGMQQRAQM
jgi:NitT/TauT family transport system ATP-binding protein